MSDLDKAVEEAWSQMQAAGFWGQSPDIEEAKQAVESAIAARATAQMRQALEKAPWVCLKCGEEFPDHAEECPFRAALGGPDA